MYHLLRALIFRVSPERAHNATIALLRLAGAVPPISAALRGMFWPGATAPAGTSADGLRPLPAPEVRVFGLTFANPVGLAAGYDKDGLGWRGLATLGFGHIEIGTVTPRPQTGNAGTRVFRLVEDQAIINRMGFPNRGAAFVARRLQGPRPACLILGVNIGKNKTTPLADAAQDYLTLIRTFAPLADYLTINISSPNTPGLRSLQGRQALAELLPPLVAERQAQRRQLGRRIPLLVKLAPDLTSDELDDALEVILTTGLDGVVLSNTSYSREGLRSPAGAESGGLSGAPIRKRNTAIVRAVVQRTGGVLPVVASGGVMRPEDAAEKLEAGAALIQLFTGLIYAGPTLVRDVLAHNWNYVSGRSPLHEQPVWVPEAA